MPFVWIAWVFRKRIIFVENSGRIGLSLSGKLSYCSPASSTFSGPSSRMRNERSAMPETSCLEISDLLHDRNVAVRVPTAGRRLRATRRPHRGRCSAWCGGTSARSSAFAYASEAVIAQYVRDADVVVCHACAGTTALALLLGHRPLVLARRADRGENIDDHQVAFAERLARYGLVTHCLDADDIVRHDASPSSPCRSSPRRAPASSPPLAPHWKMPPAKALPPPRGVRSADV